MRIPLEELMEKLAVNRVLSPYETQPWMMYDDDTSITCSAEVRMGPQGEDIEAEIQFLYDEDATIPELFVEDGFDEEELEALPEDHVKTPLIHDGRMQVMIARAAPVAQENWGFSNMTIKGIEYASKFHDWEGKGCEFFTACIQAINMGELPDIDAFIKRLMKDDSFGGSGRRGRIGRKGLKVAQNNPHSKPDGMGKM